MIRRLMTSSCLAFFIVFFLLNTAYAQQTAELSDEQVKERLGFLENALDSAQPRAQAWLDGWIAGYGTGAFVLGCLAKSHWNDVKPGGYFPPLPPVQPVRDRDFAEDMLVGGVTCALGVGGMLINPFEPAYGPEKLRLMPEATPEERRLKLLQGEELLRRCARREKEGRGWVTHLLNLGVNAAAGLVTVLAFDRPWYDGLITFASSEAVSLLNIYTQPRRAIHDLTNYELRYLGKQGAYTPEPSDRKFYFSISPGGFSVGMRF